MDIYNRIQVLISQNGINGIELGKILGLKKSPLTDWKNGKSKPTIDQIIKICEYFAISADYILLGSTGHSFDTEKTDITKPTSNLSEDKLELLNNYDQLDSRGKHKVQTIIYEELDRVKQTADCRLKKERVS